MTVTKILPEKFHNALVTFVTGLMSFVLFIATQMISSRVETNKWITLVRVIVISLSVVCYLLCWISSDSNKAYRRQIAWVNVCNLVFHILFCVVTFQTAWGIRYYSVIFMELAWFIAIFVILWESRSILAGVAGVLQDGNMRFYLTVGVVMATVLVVLSYDVGGAHFVWDARSFYDRMSNLETTDAFDIGKFFIFNHVDVTYFFSVFLLWRITGDLSNGYFIYGALCLFVITLSVVLILKKSLQIKDRYFYILATVACLFSPYVCGMSTYNTYDYAICCFTPLLILFAINEDWIYFLLTAFYISQLKETGLIFAGAVCVGIIVKEMLCDKISFRKAFLRKRTVAQALVAAVFVLFYVVYSNWWRESADIGEGFGIDPEHIKKVLKMFLVLNYEWLVILLVIALLIIVTFLRRPISGLTVILASTAVIPLVFYMFYVTGTYPRYTDAIPICMLLILIEALSSMGLSIVFRRVFATGLAILMLLSSFFSFDPVSKAVFTSEDIGNSSIYFPVKDFDFGGDPCVYNRQYYGMDIVLDKALKKAIDADVDFIAVSNGNNTNTWAIDGGMYAYNENEGKRVFTEFWNVNKNTRDPIYKWEYFDNPDYIQMDIRYIFPDDDIISSLQTEGSFIYIYLPSQNGDREKAVRNAFTVVEDGSYASHGWVLSYIIGKAD